MKHLIRQLTPLLLIAFALGMFAFGMMLLAYLLLFGMILSLCFTMISWVKKTFFPTKLPAKPVTKQTGRIIDSEEWNQL